MCACGCFGIWSRCRYRCRWIITLNNFFDIKVSWNPLTKSILLWKYSRCLVFVSQIHTSLVRSHWRTKAFAASVGNHSMFDGSGGSGNGGVLNVLWLTLTLTLLDILVIGPTTTTAMFSFYHRLRFDGFRLSLHPDNWNNFILFSFAYTGSGIPARTAHKHTRATYPN